MSRAECVFNSDYGKDTLDYLNERSMHNLAYSLREPLNKLKVGHICGKSISLTVRRRLRAYGLIVKEWGTGQVNTGVYLVLTDKGKRVLEEVNTW